MIDTVKLQLLDLYSELGPVTSLVDAIIHRRSFPMFLHDRRKPLIPLMELVVGA